MDILKVDNLAVIKTENQFVIIINEVIYGPYRHKMIDTILELFKENK